MCRRTGTVGRDFWARLGRMVPVAAALFLSSVFSTTGARAACGDFYRVQNGDTLQLIALREIGNDDFRAIFRANSDILSDPSQIEVGQLLFLPCAGSDTNRRAALAAANRRPTARDDRGDRLAAAAPNDPPDEAADSDSGPVIPEAPGKPPPADTSSQSQIPVASTSALAPLSDRGRTSDGLAARLLNESLKEAGDPRGLQPVIVDDWRAHLSLLLPTGAFPIGLAWPRPDCTRPSTAPETQALCEEYLFSDPYYELRVSLIVPAESALADAQNPEALQGATICRPVGLPPIDLENLPVSVVVVTESSAAGCAWLLLQGRVAAISLVEDVAGQLLDQADPPARFVKAKGLSRLVPIHAIAHKRDTGAAELIELINRGLRDIKLSGRWFEIVVGHLRETTPPVLQ